MKKGTFFKIGIVLAILIALVAVGAIIAVKSINTEQLKEILITQVEKSTGRTLAIDGPMKIKIGLVPRVVLNDARLSNPPGSTRPNMIQLKRLEVEIALPPLLKKQIVVDRLILSSPDILLETDPHGPGNLNLIAPDQAQAPLQAEKTEPPDDSGSGSNFHVAINELKIENGKCTIYNRATKQTEQITIEVLTLRRDTKTPDLVNVQLLATVRGNKIDLGGSLGGIDLVENGQPWPIKLQVMVGDMILQAEGRVADLSAFRGIDIQLSAQGKELAEVVRMAGDLVPRAPDSIGPFRVSAQLNDEGEQLSLKQIDLQLGRKAVVEVQAQGMVKNLSSNPTPEVNVRIESTDPGALASLTGAAVPIKGPVRLVGQVRGSGNTWNLSDLSVTANRSDIKGALQIQWGKRPFISGQLASTTLIMDDFAAAASSDSRKNSGQKSVKSTRDGRIFSDQPLPLSSLKEADADLKLQVGKLLLDDRQLNDVQLTVALKNGSLSVAPFRFGIAGGTLDGKVQLDSSGKTPTMEISANGKGIELGKLQDQGPLSGGKSDLKVHLKGRGASVRAIMASLSGETVVSVGEGRLANRALNWAGGDLLLQVLSSINPLSKSENSTRMSCAAVRFVIRDGVATANNGIGMRTEKVDVVGSGTVNLRNEHLDLGIKPQARGGVGVSLSTPLAGLVRVNGTLAKPSMGIDTTGTLKTAASVGAGVATGGLSTLGGLLLDKVSGDSNPCLTALGKGQATKSTPSNKKKGNSTKKASPEENLLQSIFGK